MADDRYREALTLLDRWAADPRAGIPEDLFVFVSRLVPLVNVDLLIKDDRARTLLTWREDDFYGAGWHVPGGIIRYKEPAAQRVQATARAELGAEVESDPMPCAIEQLIEPERRVRGHFISLLYRCRLIGVPDDRLRFTGGAPKPGQWAWHPNCPPNLISAQDTYRKFI
jgi:ADP-ribose pyrophosphatase YjhB (NUDIX family)